MTSEPILQPDEELFDAGPSEHDLENPSFNSEPNPFHLSSRHGAESESDAPSLKFTPLEQFAAVDEPGAESLARASAGGTIIPANGKVLVYGDGGAGKTTLVLDLCFALAAGDSWLGLVDVDRPLRIGWIENEGPRQEFRDKLERKLATLNVDLAGNLFVLEEPWAKFTFRDEQQRHAIAHAATELELDMLVFGPVATSGMVGGGTPDEIRDFDALLDDVLHLVERPFAITAIHHENRAGQTSGAWERVPDTLIHVQTTRQRRHTHPLAEVPMGKRPTQHIEPPHLGRRRDLHRRHETRNHRRHNARSPDRSRPREPRRLMDEIRDSRENGEKLVRGNLQALEALRDRLITDGTLINGATREGRFNLWTADDPEAPRSSLRTDSERLPFHPPASETDTDPFPRSLYREERKERNGHGRAGDTHRRRQPLRPRTTTMNAPPALPVPIERSARFRVVSACVRIGGIAESAHSHTARRSLLPARAPAVRSSGSYARVRTHRYGCACCCHPCGFTIRWRCYSRRDAYAKRRFGERRGHRCTAVACESVRLNRAP